MPWATSARMKRWPHVFVGWFWYLGTLVPVIGIVHTGFQSMANRFVYMPSMGLYLLVAWQAGLVARRGTWQRATVALAGALNRWIQSPQLLQQMGQRGRNKVVSRYTVARVADVVEGIYVRTLRARNRIPGSGH